MKRCWCGGEAAQDGDRWYCVEQSQHDPEATGRPRQFTRLYIAGPMTGYAECNFPAFRIAKAVLQDRGFDVVSPADFGDPGSHYCDLIADDLRAMLGKTKDDACHGVATLDYWWESVGARNEVQVAGILKMPVLPVDEWIKRGPWHGDV
jgi:hypothetical protein